MGEVGAILRIDFVWGALGKEGREQATPVNQHTDHFSHNNEGTGLFTVVGFAQELLLEDETRHRFLSSAYRGPGIRQRGSLPMRNRSAGNGDEMPESMQLISAGEPVPHAVRTRQYQERCAVSGEGWCPRFRSMIYLALAHRMPYYPLHRYSHPRD